MSFPPPLIHGTAGHRRSRGGRYANPRHHFGDGRSPRTRWPCEASNVPTFFDGAYMVYFVEEALLLHYIIYELLGGLAAATALEADPLIEGKIEVILEDTAENKHLIDENEHLSAANTQGFVKVVGTKKDAETMSMVGYVQFDNAVDVELWDGSPVYIVSH